MTAGLLKPCLTCGTLTRNGSRCTAHAKTAARGYGAAWQRTSRQQRATTRYCQQCGTTTDLTADHVTPLARGGDGKRTKRSAAPATPEKGSRFFEWGQRYDLPSGTSSQFVDVAVKVGPTKAITAGPLDYGTTAGWWRACNRLLRGLFAHAEGHRGEEAAAAAGLAADIILDLFDDPGHVRHW